MTDSGLVVAIDAIITALESGALSGVTHATQRYFPALAFTDKQGPCLEVHPSTTPRTALATNGLGEWNYRLLIGWWVMDPESLGRGKVTQDSGKAVLNVCEAIARQVGTWYTTGLPGDSDTTIYDVEVLEIRYGRTPRGGAIGVEIHINLRRILDGT